MGNALRLHPLLVIFGLLAGGEIYGLAGALSRCRCSPPGGRSGSSSPSGSPSSRWQQGGEVVVPVEVEKEPAEVKPLKPTG